jgi:hypothetical protein
MHYYGLSRTDIDGMNQVEIQGWMAMIPDLQERFGEIEHEVGQPDPTNIIGGNFNPR